MIPSDQIIVKFVKYANSIEILQENVLLKFLKKCVIVELGDSYYCTIFSTFKYVLKCP